ncbi:MAG: lysophospholipid acyltransferase family protein [Odoribacter sp.]
MASYFLYGIMWICSFLPLRILYFFSDLYYYPLYYLIRYRRKVVRTNLQNSFPEKALDEIIQIEKRYYHHLCDLFVEMYRLWHIPEKEMRRRCVFKHTEVLERYYKQNKSVIGVFGHFGNWEWMTSYALWADRNVDFYPLYKPLHTKIIDKMMLQIRSHFGATPIPKNDILRLIIKNLKEKKLFMAAFIADQTPKKDNLNFWMTFLNQATPVFVGTEKIATKFNLPVISLHMRLVRRGYYEVDFVDLCKDPSKLAPGELTRMHTKVLEEQIKLAPEMWLWSHRRWKHTRESILMSNVE